MVQYKSIGNFYECNVKAGSQIDACHRDAMGCRSDKPHLKHARYGALLRKVFSFTFITAGWLTFDFNFPNHHAVLLCMIIYSNPLFAVDGAVSVSSVGASSPSENSGCTTPWERN